MKTIIRIFGPALLAVLASALVLSVSAASTAKPILSSVTPTLACVAQNRPSLFTAVFGYTNSTSSVITVPVGTNNTFKPTPRDRGQPTSFLPGSVPRAFTVGFDGSRLTWTLNGQSVSASSKSAPCSIGGDITWTSRSNMPTGRIQLGAAGPSNGGIYAIGGEIQGGVQVATVEEFDPVADAWATRSSMPTPRSGLVVATAGNWKVYAIGGWNSQAWSAAVEVYDPATNTWTAKTSMPTARAWFGGAVAANGKIYVVGGQTPGYQVVATVDEYDPATDTWTSKASMSAPRYWEGVASANGKVYAIGGADPSGVPVNRVEEYNPTTNSWTTKASMPTSRWNLGAVTDSNGLIYAVGGINNGALTTVEEYDPLLDQWTSRAALSEGRAGMGLTLGTNGKIYMIGGSGTDPSLLTSLEEGVAP